jgi:hypothetical protein
MRKYVFFILIMFIVFRFSCIDYGITPIGTKITGKIVFTGQWPENTSYSAVALATEVPPGLVPDISYLAGYCSVPYYDKPDTFYFEINDLKSGTYNWLIVAVIGSLDSLGPNNVVAEYKDPDNPELTGSITIGSQEVFDIGVLYVDFNSVHIPVCSEARTGNNDINRR